MPIWFGYVWIPIVGSYGMTKPNWPWCFDHGTCVNGRILAHSYRFWAGFLRVAIKMALRIHRLSHVVISTHYYIPLILLHLLTHYFVLQLIVQYWYYNLFSTYQIKYWYYNNIIIYIYIYILPGWLFQTWILFSISYMGCHPSHWLICFKMVIAPPTSHDKMGLLMVSIAN